MATFLHSFAPPGVVVDAADRFVRRPPAAVPAGLTWVWRRDDAGALVGHWHKPHTAPAQACPACAEAA
jgi:hypothetical protein